MTRAIIELPPIDLERDIVPYAAVVPDYNGDPVVHVFVTGERVMRMLPTDDWNYELMEPTTTDERQAFISLAFHLGGITEEQEQWFTETIGSDTEATAFALIMERPTDEGHALVAWAGIVAKHVYRAALQDEVAAPTGW